MYSAGAAIIDGLQLENLQNADDAIVNIYKTTNVSISNLYAKSLTSSYSGVIMMTQVQNLGFLNYTIAGSRTTYGSGGCIGIVSSSKGLTANLTDGVLSSCSAVTGTGGGINLDSISTSAIIQIIINSLEITASVSKDGAMFYISNKVVFSEGRFSHFTNIYGEGNTANQGGVITDNHEQGLLFIDRLTLYKNQELHSGIYAFYSMNVYILSINNADISFGLSFGAVLSFRSLEQGCSFSLSNSTIHDIEALAIEITEISLTVSNLTVSYTYGFITTTTECNVIINEGYFYFLSYIAVAIMDYCLFECVN